MNVEIRAKRILNRLSGYDSSGMNKHDSDRLSEQNRALGATPIGIYLNASPHGQEKLSISNLGILVESEKDQLFVAYKNVERIDIVANGTSVEQDVSKKAEADGLLVQMSDSSQKLIPVRNGNGKYRDVFEFARFLRRVVEDTKEDALQTS